MPASAWMHSLKNSFLSKEVLAGGRKFLTSKSGSRLARYASMGAGLGAARGLFDNVTGNDRVSVMGGAIQGATYGAAFMGLSGAWKYGRRMKNASMAMRRANYAGTGRAKGVFNAAYPAGIARPSIMTQARGRAVAAANRRGMLL